MSKNFLKILILIFVVGWFLWNKNLFPTSATLNASISVNASQNLGNIPKVLGTNLSGVQFRDVGSANQEPLKEILKNHAKNLSIKTIRYPNGCDADRYDWKNPWALSVAEFVEFSRQVGAEPYWVLNIQGEHQHAVCARPEPYYRYPGTIEEAADLVEYANTPNDGSNPNSGWRWAVIRASPPEFCRERGLNEKLCASHPQPFNIKYWEIANEPWALQESGFEDPPDPTGFARNYARVANELAQELKEVDPNIKLTLQVFTRDLGGVSQEIWNTVMKEEPGLLSRIDRIKDHFYGSTGGNGESLVWVQANVNYFIEELKRFSLEKTIDQTEWNLKTWGENPSPAVETLEHGLFTARIIEAFIKQKIGISHQHNLNYAGRLSLLRFFGWPTLSYYLPPSYHAFHLFGKHFGSIRVSSSIQSPTFNYTDPSGNCRINSGCPPSVANVPYLTVIASKNNEASKVYLMVTNGHSSEAIQTSVSVTNLPFDPSSVAKVFTLNGPSMDSKNDPDHPNTVSISESTFTLPNPGRNLNFNYSFPAHSVTAIEILKPIYLASGWNQITWPDVSGKKASDAPLECPIAVVKENFWLIPYIRNFGGVNFNFENGETYYIKCNQETIWQL